MLLNRLIYSLLCAAALGFGPAVARAADAFRLVRVPVLIPERGEVLGYLVTTGSDEIAFLPPPRWHVDANPEKQTIGLYTEDFGTAFQFHILPHPTLSEQPPKAENWRGSVTNRFAEGKIIREFPCFSSAQTGVAFDVERPAAGDSIIITRLAFLPFEHGTIEFELTTRPEKLEQYHFVFNSLLSSMRITARTPKPNPFPGRP